MNPINPQGPTDTVAYLLAILRGLLASGSAQG